METNNGESNYEEYEKDQALYMHMQISFIVELKWKEVYVHYFLYITAQLWLSTHRFLSLPVLLVHSTIKHNILTGNLSVSYLFSICADSTAICLFSLFFFQWFRFLDSILLMSACRIFTARRHASAVYDVTLRLSVRVFVTSWTYRNG